MKLSLTDDDGVVLETWYIADTEISIEKVKQAIENKVPEVYESKEEYEELKIELEK